MKRASIKPITMRRGSGKPNAMTPLGLYLREKRAKAGISQKEMAAGIGVTAAYLSALEHGQRGMPSFALLQRIIGYLGVIWDEADAVQKLALLSNPKVSVDTRNLSAKATELACRLSLDISTWDEATLDALLESLPETSEQ